MFLVFDTVARVGDVEDVVDVVDGIVVDITVAAVVVAAPVVIPRTVVVSAAIIVPAPVPPVVIPVASSLAAVILLSPTSRHLVGRILVLPVIPPNRVLHSVALAKHVAIRDDRDVAET